MDARYQAANLYIATVDLGKRLPSIYFSDSGATSRARQMHGSGPTLTAWKTWEEYFFPDKPSAKAAGKEAKNTYGLDPKQQSTWESGATKTHGMTRTVNKGHLQIRWDGTPKKGNPHPSGGLAESAAGQYSNQDCKYIAAACLYNRGDKNEKAARADLNPHNPTKWQVP